MSSQAQWDREAAIKTLEFMRQEVACGLARADIAAAAAVAQPTPANCLDAIRAGAAVAGTAATYAGKVAAVALAARGDAR
jgi:hypothetical protein